MRNLILRALVAITFVVALFNPVRGKYDWLRWIGLGVMLLIAVTLFDPYDGSPPNRHQQNEKE